MVAGLESRLGHAFTPLFNQTEQRQTQKTVGNLTLVNFGGLDY